MTGKKPWTTSVEFENDLAKTPELHFDCKSIFADLENYFERWFFKDIFFAMFQNDFFDFESNQIILTYDILTLSFF